MNMTKMYVGFLKVHTSYKTSLYLLQVNNLCLCISHSTQLYNQTHHFIFLLLTYKQWESWFWVKFYITFSTMEFSKLCTISSALLSRLFIKLVAYIVIKKMSSVTSDSNLDWSPWSVSISGTVTQMAQFILIQNTHVYSNCLKKGSHVHNNNT